jgi:hypothetical protein
MGGCPPADSMASAPRSATLHQFKLESGINGAPLRATPHLFRFDLELDTLRAKEVTVFCL